MRGLLTEQLVCSDFYAVGIPKDHSNFQGKVFKYKLFFSLCGCYVPLGSLAIFFHSCSVTLTWRKRALSWPKWVSMGHCIIFQTKWTCQHPDGFRESFFEQAHRGVALRQTAILEPIQGSISRTGWGLSVLR